MIFFFEGVTGALIKLDHNADSEGNFSVAALKPYEFRSPDDFTCDYMIVPVATFQQGDNPVSNNNMLSCADTIMYMNTVLAVFFNAIHYTFTICIQNIWIINSNLIHLRMMPKFMLH